MALTAFLRPPPQFARAVEDVVGASREKVVCSRGLTVPAVCVSLGDDVLAVHDPTMIEPFTSAQGGWRIRLASRPVPAPVGKRDGGISGAASCGVYHLLRRGALGLRRL